MSENKGPVEKFRNSGVEVAVWKRYINDKPMYSVSLSSNYKDKEGNWKNGQSIRDDRALIAAELIRQAWAWIVDKKAEDRAEQEQGQGQSGGGDVPF